MLTLSYVVRTETGVRSYYDHRRKVTRVVASYRDESGNEYRRSFEGPTREPAPIPPKTMND